MKTSPSDQTITLRPLQPGDLPALVAAAARDKHRILHPTHVVRRGDDIVGYGSLGSVRMMFAWLDSHKLNGPESFRAWRIAEQELKRQGGAIALPCTSDSPLRQFVPRMGYLPVFECGLYLKQF